MSSTTPVGYYHLLEDGALCPSRQPKQIGETYLSPVSKKQIKVKFTLTAAEYTQCIANREDLVKMWTDGKNEIVRARTGWNSVSQQGLRSKIYQEILATGEPLMRETFFLTMQFFK